jgi:hypothetical protein
MRSLVLIELIKWCSSAAISALSSVFASARKANAYIAVPNANKAADD